MNENLPSPALGGFGSTMAIIFGFVTNNQFNQFIGVLGGVLGLGIAFFSIVNAYRTNVKTQIETEKELVELRMKQIELERLEKEKQEEE